MQVRSIGILVLLSVGLSACSETDPRQPPVPAFDVRTQTDAWLQLWNTYDLDLVDPLFLDDARLTYLSSEREGVIQGLKEVREHHASFGFISGGASPPQNLWLEEIVSSTYELSATVSARWFFGDRSAVSDSVQQGPMTVVYVLDGDVYKIAHMHFANY